MGMFKVLMAACCEEHDVAPKVVASRDELEDLAIEPSQAGAVLTGWRARVFGNAAVALRDGRVALVVRDGRVVSLPVGETAEQEVG